MIYDFVVVGGGIVGAATARHLVTEWPGSSLLLVEKESDFGVHQTGHNSGVVHSGIYYAPGSLKAELCRRGGRMLEEYVAERGIPFLRTGKLLVATTGRELAGLDALRERAGVNRIATELLDAAELRRREPHVRGLGALLVPSTGITDFRMVNRAFADDVQAAGGELRASTAVTGVRESATEVVLTTTGEEVRARRVVFCAGVQADRMARLAGVRSDARIVPFRGEYYDVRDEKAGLVEHLVYPVPDPTLPFLGVHVTRTVDGGLNVGPNAVLGLAREKYPRFSFDLRDAWDVVRFPGMWRVARTYAGTGIRELHHSASKRAYLKLCRRYCPSLELEDLTPREAGIRAQAVLRDGSFVHDFLLASTPRTLHVLNAPSPAATSALPIAEEIAGRVMAQSRK